VLTDLIWFVAGIIFTLFSIVSVVGYCFTKGMEELKRKQPLIYSYIRTIKPSALLKR